MNIPMTACGGQFECSHCGTDNVTVGFCAPWISIICQDCESIAEIAEALATRRPGSVRVDGGRASSGSSPILDDWRREEARCKRAEEIGYAKDYANARFLKPSEQPIVPKTPEEERKLNVLRKWGIKKRATRDRQFTHLGTAKCRLARRLRGN